MLTRNTDEMDWVGLWMQRILDMDLQFTRQRFGYQQLKEAMESEQGADPRRARELETPEKDILERFEGGGSLPKSQELESWEEDKLVELFKTLS
jgi:hypothetical protein